MTRVRVETFTLSLDGYGSGRDQSLENPLGVGGEALHEWVVSTRSWRRAHGKGDGAAGIDDEFAARGARNVGAWIMGRNMFAPSRGPWSDTEWKGWWGSDPPFHAPVFVLTHHARAPLAMAGGTTFHFVTGGIHDALEQAKQAAGTKDVQIGGGASTIRQYLRAQLIDEMHFAMAPVVLGGGERPFEDVDLRALGYECAHFAASEKAAHFVLRRG